MGERIQAFKMPLDEDDWTYFGKLATFWVFKHDSRLHGDPKNLEPKTWANDSLTLAEQFVYKGIEPKAALSLEYTEQNREVI